MKKLFIVLFFALLPFCFYSKASFNALEDNDDDLILVSENIEYFNDGSYIITRIYESLPVLNRDGTYDKIGTKTQFHHDDNTLSWEYTLTGYFTINPGVSCVCYNSTYSTDIYSNYWSFHDPYNYYSANIAYGEGTFKKRILFITISTIDINLSVSCDAYGNIS